MLQSASDWWYGTESKAEEKDDDDNDTKQQKEESKNEKFEIEFKRELQSVSCLDPVIALFKLIDLEQAVKQLLSRQFENKLIDKESNELLGLFTKIYQHGVPSKAYLQLYEKEIKIGEIILSYFASFSATNPDGFGCWTRWIEYRLNAEISSKLASVKEESLRKFYQTGANQIGHDNKGRFIWFTATQKYDGYIDDDTQRKAVILLLMSFQWDRKNNTFDLNVLRNGICAYIDLSHWSMTLIGWSTVYAIKDAMVAYPYGLYDIFIANPPMLVYLVKTVAAQFFTAHSLDKFVLLEDDR